MAATMTTIRKVGKRIYWDSQLGRWVDLSANQSTWVRNRVTNQTPRRDVY